MPSFSSELKITSVFTSHLKTYFPVLHFVKLVIVLMHSGSTVQTYHTKQLLWLCCEADVRFSFFLDKFFIFSFLRKLKHILF